MINDKIILVDCDGVLLDWLSAFTRFMSAGGIEPHPGDSSMYNLGPYFGISDDKVFDYITEFNNGHWEFGTLPALPGSVRNIRRLVNDEGYRFVAITSCSTGPQTVALRKANLYNVFGDIFDNVHCVDLGESKKTHLGSYEKTWWIEDKPSACEEGLDYGHKCILLDQSWNQDYEHTEIYRAMNWTDIVNKIIGDTK